MFKQFKSDETGATTNHRLAPVLAIADAFFNSYSIILFSNNRWLGVLLLLATLNSPFIGISGAIGVIVAIISIRVLKFTTWIDPSGYYSFNSLLVSLGVAYFYPTPCCNNYLFFFTVLFLCSIITAVLSVALHQFFQNYLGLPSLSIAFVIIMGFVCFVYNRLTGTPLSVIPHRLIFDWSLPISGWLNLYLKSIGSIFFQPNLLGGLLVGLAILLHSRISFLLSLIGFAVGYSFLTMSSTFGELEIMLSGFNIVLTTVVIGGVFLVPSISSFVIAIFSSLSGALIGIAIQSAFYGFGIPPLAIPFNFTVLVILYAFKLRLKNSNPYIIDFYASSPEENLEYYYSRISRFYEIGIPQFFLPFYGEWTVTQGHNSEPTHKLRWAEAWDFEILNEDGSKFKGTGANSKDFYCFDKPIVSPANGTVVRVVDGIADNPIGQLNPRENWGNLVVIQHSGGIFSLVCHLKNGSIEVSEGQYVKAGDKLATCGNSGRSPYPHLHFHLQGTSEPGSPTIKATLVNYIVKNPALCGAPPAFIHSGIPQKGEKIVSLHPELRLQDMLNFKVNDKYTFKVITSSGGETSSGMTFEENWDIKVDFWGNLSIISDRATSIDFSIYNGIFNVLEVKGKSDTALHYFALSLSRFPYVEEEVRAQKEYSWTDQPPLSLVLPSSLKSLVDFFSFIGRPARLLCNYKAHSNNNSSFDITGKANLKLFGYKSLVWDTHCIFDADNGIVGIEVKGPGNFEIKVVKIN
jgi:urea transporter